MSKITVEQWVTLNSSWGSLFCFQASSLQPSHGAGLFRTQFVSLANVSCGLWASCLSTTLPSCPAVDGSTPWRVGAPLGIYLACHTDSGSLWTCSHFSKLASSLSMAHWATHFTGIISDRPHHNPGGRCSDVYPCCRCWRWVVKAGCELKEPAAKPSLLPPSYIPKWVNSQCQTYFLFLPYQKRYSKEILWKGS